MKTTLPAWRITAVLVISNILLIVLTNLLLWRDEIREWLRRKR